MPTTVSELLERLAVPRGATLYAQTSADWIQHGGFKPVDVLPALREWTGETGTLVMPSYPFHSTHVEYLSSSPVFDVRKTPSAIGLLPEILRRTRGVARSLDPDFCVAALGPEAPAITGDEPADGDPFGPDSSYQRILDREATFIGLGVSLNTCSFMHVIDSRAASGYPSPVYDPREYRLRVIDTSGGEREVMRLALRPEFQRLTSPSSIIETMRPDGETYTSLQINGAQFFRWRLKPWADWCLAHARSAQASGEWPCWLTRLRGLAA